MEGLLFDKKKFFYTYNYNSITIGLLLESLGVSCRGTRLDMKRKGFSSDKVMTVVC